MKCLSLYTKGFVFSQYDALNHRASLGKLIALILALCLILHVTLICHRIIYL